MLLQLDPDDDEAEQAIRMALERRSTRNLAAALREIAEGFTGSAEDWDLVDDFRQDFEAVMNDMRFRQPFEDTVTRMVQDSADLGINVAVSQFEQIGLGFDWDSINEMAHEWAGRYSGQLIRNIDETTRRGTQQIVARWIENGEGRDQLIEDLTRIYGRQRAELIASTEITRSFAEGNKLSYQMTGVTRQMEWRTAADERVCPICGPLHGKRLGFDTDWRGFLPDEVQQAARQGFTLPPAHPRCRCWVIPVVVEA